MPNGGMPPCCRVCKWAKLLENTKQVYCQHHQLTVFIPMYSFCTDLGSDRAPGLAEFIARNDFEPGIMYQWLEFTYTSEEYPTLPQYYREPTALVPLSEYATWEAEQAIQMSHSLHKQRREELEKMNSVRIVLADLQGELLETWQKNGGDKSYVSTHHGSIFDVECDALVSPANSFGFMDGGIDMAISKFFGWHVQERLQKLIQTKHHGELLVGTAEIVTTDHPKIPYVISAPTMRVPMILKDTVNIYLAIRAVLLLVKYGKFEDGTAIADKVRVIAFPGMGTGVGQVSPEIFVWQMRKAVEDVIEEQYQFPESWWEAAQKHQLLYTNKARDLQHKEMDL
jgi:O-acetyl-ADP-ribose deacetylase (regulator of RNase III)